MPESIFDIIKRAPDFDFRKDLWSNMDKKEREQYRDAARSVGFISPENKGFLGNTWKGIQSGALQVASGVGSTIEEATGESAVADYFRDVQLTNQQLNPHPGYSPTSFRPSDIGYSIGLGVGQSGAALAAGVATTALTGGNAVAGAAVGTGAMMMQLYGDRVKEYREMMPDQDESTVKGLAFVSSLGESIIESVLGPEQIARGIAKTWVTGALKETTKGLVRRVGANAAKGFFQEGSEEVVQDVWNRIVARAGTENVSLPSWQEILDQFFGGAWPGLVMGGAAGVFDRGGKAGNIEKVNPAELPAGAFPADAGPIPITPSGEASPDAAGRTMQEAYYDEVGIPYSRMTPEEQRKEGIGVVTRDGEQEETNGLYNRETGEVKINPNNEGEVFTHGHELDHVLTNEQPDLAKTLHDVMDQELNDAGNAEQDGRDRKELYADMLGRIMEDPETMRLTVQRGNEIDAGFGERFLKAVIEYAKRMMAYAKAHADLKGAEQYFNDYKRVRDTAADVLAEFKRRTGKSTEAENVVGVNGSQDVVSVPVSELNIDPARFQFKSRANKKTGVDENNKIGGRFDPKTAGNLYVWEDRTGRKFVVNGHHRFQLAKENGIENVNAIIDREADGVTAEQARRNGVLINIRDEQGDVQDYAEFVRREKMDEDTAEKEGLLSRRKGRTGYLIGRYATDNLYGQFRDGDVSEGAAAVIADVARGDEGLEVAGIRAAKNGMPLAQLGEFMKALKNTPREKSEQGDLFGFDDSAIQTAETLSKLASKHIREIKDTINAAKNAINNPAAAKKLKVSVGKEAEKLLKRTQKEAARWEHWYTDPELSAQLRREAGIEEPIATATTVETPVGETPVEEIPREEVVIESFGEEEAPEAAPTPAPTTEAPTTPAPEATNEGGDRTQSVGAESVDGQRKKPLTATQPEVSTAPEATKGIDAVKAYGSMWQKKGYQRFYFSSDHKNKFRDFLQMLADTGLIGRDEVTNIYISSKNPYYDFNNHELVLNKQPQDAAANKRYEERLGAAFRSLWYGEAMTPATAPVEEQRNDDVVGEALNAGRQGELLKNTLRGIINSDHDASMKQRLLTRLAENNGMTAKEMQERCEAEVVAMGREIAAENISDEKKYKKLVSLYNRQPNFSKRTSTSIMNQAYSTPVPLAWALGNRIGLDGKTVYEPTAGTGMLTIAGQVGNTDVNEIDVVRGNILNQQGFAKVTSNDASKTRPNKKYDRIIMNPPFGAGTKTTFNGFALAKLDHVIAARALEAMKENGKAAIIVGANTDSRESGRATLDDSVFMNYLYNNFNVKDNFIVDGNLYRKQGASYPVRVITLEGRRENAPGNVSIFAPVSVEKIDNWDTLYQKLKGTLPDENVASERGGSVRQSGRVYSGGEGQTAAEQPAGTRRDGESVAPNRAATGTGAAEVSGNGNQYGTSRPRGETRVEGREFPESAESRSGAGVRSGSDVLSRNGDEQGTVSAENGSRADSGTGNAGRSGRNETESNGRGSQPVLLSNGLNAGPLSSRPGFGENNKIFTKEAAEAALKRIQQKMGRLNSGIDPELMYDFIQLAGYYIEANARKFADFAREMIAAFGDGIKPYLKWAYNSVREFPNASELAKNMDAVETVDAFDLDTLNTTPESTTKAAPKSDIKVGEKRGDLNNTYIAGSQSTDKMDVVTPRYMASATSEALNDLKNKVGDIDEFVRGELGYASKEEMYKGLSDVQIDGVALAIQSIKDGRALILGDQTGIGKGRQNAAMIRWAQQHGIKPVFMTVKPKLFTDMYFDGKDIGSNFKPFILAGNNDRANIVDKNDKVIVQPPKRVVNAEANFVEGRGDYDVVFTNYSQFQSNPKGKISHQRQFLTELVNSGPVLFILDEAHEAAGDSNRGAFLRNLLQNPNARVLYASATFAKRPDNMGLYFKTSLGTALDNIENLKEVITRGGVPLQQVVSEELAKNGEMIRRERDFKGVTFERVIATPQGEIVSLLDVDGTMLEEKSPEKSLIETYNSVADVLRQMLGVNQIITDAIRKAIKNSGRYGNANSRERTNVATANFASVTHNYIAQLLLAAKCDTVVDRAIMAFRKGQKPVIGLTNTLESPLKTYIENNGLEAGDEANMSFADILENAYNNFFKASVQLPTGMGIETVWFSPSELDLEQYDAMMQRGFNKIRSIALPVSPIDYIKNRLEQAGIRTGEITGRTVYLEYGENGSTTIKMRSDKEKNANTYVNAFNSGKLDALVLNAAGSTGLSIHASKKFVDQKPRHMVMAQPSLDISVVMQMFGRIMRSGQVVLPSYEILATPLAAERRPMMVLSKKLQSLNANTTANNKGTVDMGEDFLNKYGDVVAQMYLNENPDFAEQVGLETTSDENITKGIAPENVMTKLTGKIAVLSNDQQNEIYDELSQRYRDYVDFLKKTDNYDLEISVKSGWDAREVESTQIAEGDPSGSVFQRPVYVKKITIQEKRSIRKAEDVLKEAEKNIGEPDKIDRDLAPFYDAVNKLTENVAGETELRKAMTRRNALSQMLDNFRTFIRQYSGRLLDLQIGDEVYYAYITGYRLPQKINPNQPIAASKIMIDIAVADTIGKIPVSYSRIRSDQVRVSRSYERMENKFTGENRTVSVDRHVMTGNLLRAIDYAQAGKIVSYSKHDGGTETALLMPRSWSISDLHKNPKYEIHSASEALQEIAKNGSVSGSDVEIYKGYGGDYIIDVPTRKNVGGKYYLDRDLIAITGDFVRYGSSMRAFVSPGKVNQAIERIMAIPNSRLVRKQEEGNTEYSTKRRRQINPIVRNGVVREEYQDLLENGKYTPETVSEWERAAIAWIKRVGGVRQAVEMVLNDTEHNDRHIATIVRRYLIESDAFNTLPRDQRIKLEEKNIEAGTEWGREGVARRLASMTLNTVERVQAVFNKLNEKLGDEKRKRLRNEILDEFGIDIYDLPEDIAEDKARLDALLRAMSAKAASWGDKAYEYWINAILSSPTTHFANVFGNTFNAAYELGVKRFVEAAINTIARRKNGATFGEFKEMVRSIDWGSAFERAKIAFDQELLANSGKLERSRVAIGGTKGRLIRTPGRLLRAADEFAKAIICPMEATAYAYRMGTEQGLSGEKLNAFIEEEIKDVDSASNAYAKQRALDLTFQEKPGRAIEALIAWREGGGAFAKILKYVLPFIKTPGNILRQGVRKSPLGVLNLGKEMIDIARGKKSFDSQTVGLLAEQVIAWGAVAMLASMGGDDDDDLPVLTGTSPKYGSAEQRFKANKIPPYSIRIGNNYYSYKRIEPLSTGLAFIADGLAAFRAAKNGEDGTRIMKRLIGGMKQLVVEKSFLDSLGEINRFVSDPERDAPRMLTNYLASWMPNVVRTTINAFDDNVRDYNTKERGLQFWEDQFWVVTGRAGITKAAPKYDYFGRPIKKDSLADSGPIWQMMRLVPIQSVAPDENMNKAERLMWNYNRLHPDAEYYPNVPAYYFTRDGRKLYFAGENYAEFAQKSGQLALKQINNAFRHGLLHENRPTEADIELIRKIFTRARKEVRDDMVRQRKFSE